MVLRPFLFAEGSCASYLFGCTSRHELAVVDAHAELVDDYIAAAEAIGSPINSESPLNRSHGSSVPRR